MGGKAKAWKGSRLLACKQECQGHREHAQKRLGLQQWRPLAVVCACVLFAGACLCSYASACVCALLTALWLRALSKLYIRRSEVPFFDIFASPRWSLLRMRTKVASFFIFFQDLSNKKKFKKLRPKMTKIASRGGPALRQDPPPPWFEFLVIFDFFAPWYRRGWEASSVKIL